MRGLVNNPKGEIIPRPIISSYREGLSVAEYFIATHGARKGLADTALRTADSGYLTRRLVDVSQDVIIREDDCGTTKGLELPIAAMGSDGALVKDANVENSVFSRTLASEAADAQGDVLAQAGEDVGDVLIDKLIEAGVETIKVRSVLTCDSAVGVCAQCYGRSLATGKLVDIGEAVGIVAANIGEPDAADDAHLSAPAVRPRPTTSRRVCPACRSSSRLAPRRARRHRRVRRTHHDQQDQPCEEGHPDARQRRRAARLPRAQARDVAGRGRPARHGRPADPGGHARPQGGHACAWVPARSALPRERRAGRLPLAGCPDPRQAHRGHRPDAAQGHRRRPRRHDPAARRARRLQALPGDQPRGRGGGQAPRVGSSGADRHHQGVACDRVVAVGRLVPGDDPRAHPGGDGGQERPAASASSRRTSSSESSSPPNRTPKYRNVVVEATEEAGEHPDRIFASDGAYSDADLATSTSTCSTTSRPARTIDATGHRTKGPGSAGALRRTRGMPRPARRDGPPASGSTVEGEAEEAVIARTGGRSNWIAVPAGMLYAAIVAALVFLAPPCSRRGGLAGRHPPRRLRPTADPEHRADPRDRAVAAEPVDCRSIYPDSLSAELTWRGHMALLFASTAPSTAVTWLSARSLPRRASRARGDFTEGARSSRPSRPSRQRMRPPTPPCAARDSRARRPTPRCTARARTTASSRSAPCAAAYGCRAWRRRGIPTTTARASKAQVWG